MSLPFRWEGGLSFLKGMTDFVLSLKLDKFSEFLFFEKEPSLQKKKSQDRNRSGQSFTEGIKKLEYFLFFLENPFFNPRRKLMKPRL